MNEDNLESLKQKVLELENENKNLHEQINKLNEIDKEEFVSYRVFMGAKKHFINWVNMITVGVATAGILAILTASFTLYLALKEKMVEKVGDYFEKDENSTKIHQSIIDYVEKGEGSKQLNEGIIKYLSSPAFTGLVLSELENELQKEEDNQEPLKFFVIAGSSTSATLKNDYLRAKRISGNYFGIYKYDIKICPPRKTGDEYGLIIGDKMPLSEAQRLVRQAIADNFIATNTSTISETSASKIYDMNNCEVIQKASVKGILTRNKVNFRTDKNLRSNKNIICSLNRGQTIEIIKEEEDVTKIQAVCPNKREIDTGFIYDYQGERPYVLKTGNTNP